MFKTIFIQKFANFLLGSKVFEQIKHIVSHFEDKALTGAQKRAAALSDLQGIGLGIAGFMLNLGIELAVAYFRLLGGQGSSGEKS